MTNEKLLTELYILTNEKLSPSGRETLDCLISNVETDIRKATYKAVGKDKLFTIANKFIKEAEKDHREKLWGAWIYNGKQYVSNGYMILRINSPIELKESEGLGVFSENLIDKSSKNPTVVKIPNVQELKAEIRILSAKASKKARIVYRLGHGFALVNAKYLCDLSEALGGLDEVLVIDTKSPIYGRSEIGDMILLPVKADNIPMEKGFYIMGL